MYSINLNPPNLFIDWLGGGGKKEKIKVPNSIPPPAVPSVPVPSVPIIDLTRAVPSPVPMIPPADVLPIEIPPVILEPTPVVIEPPIVSDQAPLAAVSIYQRIASKITLRNLPYIIVVAAAVAFAVYYIWKTWKASKGTKSVEEKLAVPEATKRVEEKLAVPEATKPVEEKLAVLEATKPVEETFLSREFGARIEIEKTLKTVPQVEAEPNESFFSKYVVPGTVALVSFTAISILGIFFSGKRFGVHDDGILVKGPDSVSRGVSPKSGDGSPLPHNPINGSPRDLSSSLVCSSDQLAGELEGRQSQRSSPTASANTPRGPGSRRSPSAIGNGALPDDHFLGELDQLAGELEERQLQRSRSNASANTPRGPGSRGSPSAIGNGALLDGHVREIQRRLSEVAGSRTPTNGRREPSHVSREASGSPDAQGVPLARFAGDLERSLPRTSNGRRSPTPSVLGGATALDAVSFRSSSQTPGIGRDLAHLEGFGKIPQGSRSTSPSPTAPNDDVVAAAMAALQEVVASSEPRGRSSSI